MASAKALDIYKKLALKTKQASGPRPGQAALPQLAGCPTLGPIGWAHHPARLGHGHSLRALDHAAQVLLAHCSRLP